ncbi:MAG TPA: hypothetical protein VLD86_12525, partial [Ilumatobacteraceae bacterium]|nr:hypothetical protein [Ilumatobacteraceae bacterium]
MFRDSAPASPDRRSFLAAGAVALAVIVVVDVTSQTMVLIPLLVLAALICSTGGTERGTLLVASAAVAASVPLGWTDDIELSRRHWIGMLTTLLGGALATWFA